MYRSIPILGLSLAMLVGVAGCGGDTSTVIPGETTSTVAATAPTTLTSVPTTTITTTVAPTTTLPPTTTPTTTVTEPPTTTTTTVEPPTAADSLAAFFTGAEQLDSEIRAAAAAFNAGFDDVAVTLDPSVPPVVDALSAGPLAALIPPGLSIDLETAVLAVYADLDSRISALQGGVRNIVWESQLEWALDCLANGGSSADRFSDDLAAARTLAALEPPPGVAPDSVAAGVLAVRLEVIQSMNWGCESCGGVEIDAPIPVNWDERYVLDGVGFDADFVGGAWEIMIYAC